MTKLSLAAIAATLLIGSAHADIVYSEFEDDDLDASSSVNLEFAIGSNRVIGTGKNSNEGLDLDGFLFHLGAGQSLSSVIFRVLNRQIPTETSLLQSPWGLREGGYSGTLLSSDGAADILKDGDQIFFANALPVGLGTYAFAPGSMSRTGGGGTWNYEIEFIVAEENRVPEPGGLALLGLGLAGLALSRFRPKSV